MTVKPRAKQKPAAVCGFHAVTAALHRTPHAVRAVLVDRARRDRRMAELQRAARRAGAELRRVDATELDAAAGGARHQGVVALADAPAARGDRELLRHVAGLAHAPLVLALDGVQDPHNLGACLRTADAAGVDAVVLPAARACGLTPAVVKAASGAAVAVFRVANLPRALRQLKEAGLWVVGAAGGAELSLHSADLGGPLALVLGGEARGMRPLVASCCDSTVCIPMRGTVASLNVSVAAGVALFEVLRRRERGGK